MGIARELAELGSAYNSGGVNQLRNRIINGAMTIDQRNAGASFSVSGTATQYTLDRWKAEVTGGGAYTVQQSTIAPTGFTNSALITVTTADTSIASTDYYDLQQFIEGFNVSDLGWGTANAQPVTLSFWVRSSLTGTFSGSVGNGASNRSYVFSYTILSANTWEQKSVTIVGDTSGTWLTTNGRGLCLTFDLGNGSTYTQSSAGSWVATYAAGLTSAVKAISTLGATFYITGVQLEKGSTATSFNYRPHGTEEMLCQRYYYKTPSLGNFVLSGFSISTTVANLTATFPTTMRTNPTALEQSGTASNYLIRDRGGNKTCTAVPAFLYSSTNSGSITMTTTGLTQGDGVIGYTSSSYLAWSAEL